MPTVAEVLKSAGMDDAAIAALDAKAVAGFTGVLTAAEAERSQAEIAQRAATQMFDEQITPALNAWGTKEANLAAERDYYKTLAEKAKDGGFVAEVPPFVATTQQPRDANNGQWRPNGNEVPGSPNLQDLENKMGSAFGVMSDLQWQYQSLFGKQMPDAPTALVAEATANRMPLKEWAAKKYNFDGRRTEMQTEDRKKSEDAIRKTTIEERDKYWAEKGGTNPNVRQAEASRFSELRQGVKDGTRVDPLKMTREQRHSQTASAIRQETAAAATQ